jgi:oligoendopeptidase F
MHSYLSSETQPYPTAHYVIFAAEVASTLNEMLLRHYMMERATDPDVRLMLLAAYLEDMQGTVFRQSKFADFERRAHALVEQGTPLTGDLLASEYLSLVREFYGHDAGICNVDECVAYEHASIPHFFNDFYVYQYSTAFTASVALSSRIISGEDGAVERYLNFLRQGCAKPPVDLLADAGVDMRTNEPFQLAINEMNRVMDEIESILDRRGSEQNADLFFAQPLVSGTHSRGE